LAYTERDGAEVTELNQVRVQWTSSVGIDGVSTFYCTGPVGQFVNDVKAFFDSIKDLLPSDITLVYPGSGNIINDATGEPVATWVDAPPDPTLCTGGGNYAKPVGSVVNWQTGLYAGGRQIRGKTFLVPLTAGSFDTDGTVPGVVAGNIRSAANLLAQSASVMVIYSPSNHTNAAVTVATVPSIACVLRSRRD
jgi:hypothetical protein